MTETQTKALAESESFMAAAQAVADFFYGKTVDEIVWGDEAPGEVATLMAAVRQEITAAGCSEFLEFDDERLYTEVILTLVLRRLRSAL